MARDLILGTAGHIDHGKTSLVKALTGIDCDRLPEEKARGITIDIGFATPRPAALPPRHRRCARPRALHQEHARRRHRHRSRRPRRRRRRFGHAADARTSRNPQAARPAPRRHRPDQVRPRRCRTRAKSSNSRSATWSRAGSSNRRRSSARRPPPGPGHRRTEGRASPTSCDKGRGPTSASDWFRLRDRSLVHRAGTRHRRHRLGHRRAVCRSATRSNGCRAASGCAFARCRITTGRSRKSIAAMRAAINLAGVHHEDVLRGQELATPGYLVPSRVVTVRLHCLPDDATADQASPARALPRRHARSHGHRLAARLRHDRAGKLGPGAALPRRTGDGDLGPAVRGARVVGDADARRRPGVAAGGEEDPPPPSRGARAHRKALDRRRRRARPDRRLVRRLRRLHRWPTWSATPTRSGRARRRARSSSCTRKAS